MEERRSDPDEWLKQVELEEHDHTKGHLKIFFGYAAGVGKTYAMLKAAHRAKRRGVDVVLGYIEPHTRPETMALVPGLPAIPKLTLNHKGILLKEFDLDGAMQRKPQLILVDELAHTNDEGCRHKKRYQDIEELLKAGIDVYTTVNVQHLESLNDMIAAITGVLVRERIPDSIFDDADQVDLVDIEPEELMKRLQSGKVYAEEQARNAIANFFDKKNLTALREIALRRCADRVNRMLEKVRMTQKDNYYTEEHILVCLSSSPTNGRIIRTAARMASAFKGRFTALFVETADFEKMSEDNKRRLRENIQLAEQLGASIETIYGDDIPFLIAEYARISGISKMVIGRNNVRRKYFWSRAPLTEKLISQAPNLDIYIIPDRNTPVYQGNRTRRSANRFVAADLIKSFLLLTGATLMGCLFRSWGFTETNIIMVYIMGVLLTAVWTTRRLYSLVSSVVSLLIFNYFFAYPYFTFKAYNKGYPVTFTIMFLSAFITSTLAVRMKRQMRQASEAAYRTKILLETNQLIQKGKGEQPVVTVVANQLVKLLKRDVMVYLEQDKKLSEPMAFMVSGGEVNPAYISQNEQAVAAWVWKNNKHAGATTKTLGNAACMYLAIRAGDTVYGVVGISMEEQPLDTYENNIMLSILGECALALENEKAIRDREQSVLMAKNEQLRANLLRSISHDLRTPLTAISGNAGILVANADDMDREKRGRLYLDIYDDSLWLINLVENLLSVTRIEDGTMKLRLSAELLDDVIAEALRHINRKSAEHKIVVRQEEEFMLVKADAQLIIQVIINIVNNAIHYTQPGSEIVISAAKDGGMAVVTIADNGPGIPDEDKARIFDMFYTVSKGVVDSRRSLGLGLALCKSIIMAHGGEIQALDNQPTGTVFRFTLPKEEVRLRE